jgi:hypothetical protein
MCVLANLGLCECTVMFRVLPRSVDMQRQYKLLMSSQIFIRRKDCQERIIRYTVQNYVLSNRKLSSTLGCQKGFMSCNMKVSCYQGVYQPGKSGKQGKLREFQTSGKNRENSGNFIIYSGIFVL